MSEDSASGSRKIGGMPRRWLVCALAIVAAAWLAARTQAAVDSVGVDQCMVVAVHMLDDVNSADAKPGDFFRFQTVNAVPQGNRIAIPARTIGYGIVAIAAPAGRSGRPGTLVLEPRYFVLPGNVKLGVTMNHNTDALQRTGQSNGVPGYLGAVPIPGVGAAIGIFNYFHNGKNIEVKRGTVFTVFPSDDPSAEHCQTNPSY